MAGSNKPPRAGTQQDLEDRNATYLYNDRPPVEEGTPDAVAEATPDLPDLNDAIHAAMKDADPAAHRQGLTEEATISAKSVFGVGSLIAALGQSAAQPQTKTEATYDPYDTGIFGHDDDKRKTADIAYESMKLDSNGVPLSDGKINTIYSDIRAERLAQEKRRRDEEDRYRAFWAMESIDDMWDALDEDFEDYMYEVEAATADLEHAAADTRSLAEADNQRYIRENAERLDYYNRLSSDLNAELEAARLAGASEEELMKIGILRHRAEVFRDAHASNVQTLADTGRFLEGQVERTTQEINRLNTEAAQLQNDMNALRGMTAEQASSRYISDLQETVTELQRLQNDPNLKADERPTNERIAELQEELRRARSNHEGHPERNQREALRHMQGNIDHNREHAQQARQEAAMQQDMNTKHRAYQAANTEFNNEAESIIRQARAEGNRDLTREELERLDRLNTARDRAKDDLTTARNDYTAFQEQKRAEAAARISGRPDAAGGPHPHADAPTIGAGALRTEADRLKDSTAAADATHGQILREGRQHTIDRGAARAALDPAACTDSSLTAAGGGQCSAGNLELSNMLADAQAQGRTLRSDEIQRIERQGLKRDFIEGRIQEEGLSGAERIGPTLKRSVEPRTESAPPTALNQTTASASSTAAPSETATASLLPSRTPSYTLFGTSVPYTPIQTTPVTSKDILGNDWASGYGGSYTSFADSDEFHKYDPPPSDKGITPSYNTKPAWYEVAWDTTTDFMKSMFGGGSSKPGAADANPVMLAANTPATANKTLPGVGATTGAA